MQGLRASSSLSGPLSALDRSEAALRKLAGPVAKCLQAEDVS